MVILKALIDAVFAISSPSWAQTRQKAWEGNFGMKVIDLDDGDGGSIAFYALDQTWMDDLGGVLLPGGNIPPDCSATRRFD